MKKVMILGSTGYLGSELIPKLPAGEYSYICPIRNLSKIQYCNNNVNYILLDEIDKFEKIDILINLVCKYQKEYSEISDVYHTNLYIPMNIINKYKSMGLSRIITIDTNLPDYFNDYTESKHLLSDYGFYLCKQSKDLCFIDLCPEYFFGINEPSDRFIPSLINHLIKNENVDLRSGLQKRDFLLVDDLVNIINHCIVTNITGYHKIPIGSGHPVAIKDLVQSIGDWLGSNSIINYGALPDRNNEPDSHVDNTILKELNFPLPKDWTNALKQIVIKKKEEYYKH